MQRWLRSLGRIAFGFVVLAGGVAGAPAAAGVFNPETFTLANGLEVIVVTDRRAPVVGHWVWYRVGAADEPAGRSGIAHLLEHMMFKGTAAVPAGAFSQAVAGIGGRDNAFTSHDYTAYFQKVPSDQLELVMRMEADRMTNLAFTADAFELERQVVLEERASRTENRPEGLMYEQMMAVQFLAHPYGVPVIGWRHEIEALSRADAMDFYRRHYAPNNAILIVAGDVDAATVRPLAERYYGGIPRGPDVVRSRPQEPPQRALRRVEMTSPLVSAPQLNRSYIAPSQTAGDVRHAYPLTVLAEILSGGATGRLYRALVVEQRLATAAGAYYDDVSLDLSRFGFFARARPGVDPAALEAALDAEIRRLLEAGVTEDEVARAVGRAEAQAIYARDGSYMAVRAFGAALTAGLTVEDVEAWPERMAAVTVAAVNEAARAVLRREGSVTGWLLPAEGS